MRKRLWPVAHAALTLACVGCCAYLLWRDRGRDTGRASERADLALRQFHQVQWMGGDYELPRGQDHCAVVLLKFEDGRFIGRHGGKAWSARAGEPRAVPHVVMWGQTPSGPRSTVFTDWMSMSSADDFLAKVDGPAGRAFGPSDFGELRGYRVIGFAGSKQMRAGQEERANSSVNDADEAVATRKYVAVLGVKLFGSKEEAAHWVYGVQERADPAAP